MVNEERQRAEQRKALVDREEGRQQSDGTDVPGSGRDSPARKLQLLQITNHNTAASDHSNPAHTLVHVRKWSI